jgi:DNA polymerase elongation subunit (family B)
MNMEVLEYTEEQLRALSKEELQRLLGEAEDGERLFDTAQMTQKIMINSLYGAIANKYFPLFNEDMAAAITGNGRYFIRKLSNYIEETLQKMHKSEKNYIMYGDTDSVLGNTMIRTEHGDISIESLYADLVGEIEVRDENNFIKHVSNPIKAASVNKAKELEYNNINYVMKHKVKKRMFKIKCNGDEVTITEDHSMMVVRDNELIEIKPKDVKKSDKLIKIL